MSRRTRAARGPAVPGSAPQALSLRFPEKHFLGEQVNLIKELGHLAHLPAWLRSVSSKDPLEPPRSPRSPEAFEGPLPEPLPQTPRRPSAWGLSTAGPNGDNTALWSKKKNQRELKEETPCIGGSPLLRVFLVRERQGVESRKESQEGHPGRAAAPTAGRGQQGTAGGP